MSATFSIDEAFESAKNDFLQKLTNPQDYDFSKFNSIDQVYDATDEIQKEQVKSGTLRNLRKIQPFLDCMKQYVGVLDTFVQVKPEILCLIWGPIKLLLQVSSTFIKSFDMLLEVMVQIGNHLPHFGKYRELFGTNDRIKHVLCIFYKDILDFHVTVLNFFNLKKWRVFFESFWPRYASKISIILDNITRHMILMEREVTLADISEAYVARIRAYEEYERAQNFQQSQQFETVKLSLSPHLYDVDLDKIRQQLCVDAGQWLDNEDGFRRWLDPSDKLTQILWLEGIPGAGKTFLSSTIIHRISLENHLILFAFISFRHSREATSTLRVLHSFLFQLALENKDLQPILYHAYESKYRQLSGTVGYVRDLLLEMLQSVEKPYIVVDGIDEIGSLERQLLLQTLLDLCNDCASLKLLISGRGEDDISRLLRPKAIPIRVDHKNSKDIEAYVNHRIDKWHSRLNLDATTTLEIRRLLSSIASKAKGMFLYARLVLDGVFSRSNIRDVREEACNLPNGLDEAYSRIITRIDKNLRPSERLEARTILELIGCSAFPITKQEIEQAITVRPGDRDLCQDGKMFRNLTEICGPIIEFQDDFVHFVHFTVKEYLFGPQSMFFLRDSDGHQNNATKCMSYLSFPCFGPDLSDLEIARSILRGDYVFQDYAESQWLEHIKRCAPSLELPALSILCQDIVKFMDARENLDFEGLENTPKIAVKWLESFKVRWPDIFDKLYDASLFCKMKREDISLKEGDSWKNLDPFTISVASIRIRCQFDALVCPSKHRENCHCDMLKSHYGTRIFKCNRLGCKFYRIGFETEAEKDSHVRSHDRPFKCAFSNCDFAEIGFRSNAQLHQHSLKCHGNQIPSASSNTPSVYDIENLGSEDMDAVLVDAVEAGEVQYIHDLCEQIPPDKLEEVLRVAAAKSTVSMVNMLLAHGANVNPSHSPPLIEAVNAGNLDIAKLLLDHGADVNAPGNDIYHQRALDGAVANIDPEMTSVLLNYGADPKRRFKSLACLVGREANAKEDLRTMECISLIGKDFKSPTEFEGMLKIVAERSCSIPLASFLIKAGVDVNSRGTLSGSHIRGPLHIAAQRTTKPAAEFMKFLLESGADPTLEWKGRKPGDLRGAKDISQWLGMTWDELVESVQAERRKKKLTLPETLVVR